MASRFLSHSPRSQEPHANNEIYDVVIVGSGMVGSGLASLLSHNPLTRDLRVAILDHQPQNLTPPLSLFPDLRVSTLIPSSIACLERAGAWGQILPHAAPFSQMQVWDASGSGCIRWSSGDKEMGCVAENSTIQAALLSSVSKAETTSMIWPASVISIGLPSPSPSPSPSSSPSSEPSTTSEGDDGLAWLQLEDGRRLRSRLIVAADGGNSKIRAMAGITFTSHDYHQRGLVATVRTKEPNDRTAWQRFLPSGPFALLPVRGGLHNIVWTTTSEAAGVLEKMGPEEFAEAANRALRLPIPASTPSSPLSQAGEMVDGLISTLAATQSLPQRYQDPPMIDSWVGSAPKSFPLQLKHATRYVLPRFALIGDAAHAVHPLAGQGVNLGFGDAEALADAIAMARKSGSDIGDPLILTEMYEKPRRAANEVMITALDSIKTAFSIQMKPFAAARNLGLDLINRTPIVRDVIMSYAMGSKLF